MEHTPIPWHIKAQDHGGPQIWAERVQVAFAFAGDNQPSKANADFIVRAVNNHAKLLAALEGMRDAFGENEGRIPADVGSRSIDEVEAINKVALRQARAAIEEAK